MLTPVTVASSSARTTSSQSTAFGIRDKEEKGVSSRNLNVVLDCTAASGTSPTLDVEVQWSHDGTTWASAESADSFGQLTAAATKVEQYAIKGTHYRVKWTIGGTSPSFTFSVSAVETA